MSEPSDVEPAVPTSPPAQTAAPGQHEISVDLAAFLPEGTELEADPAGAVGQPVGEIDDPWDTGATEPEVPAWARDDVPPAPEPTASEPAAEPTASAPEPAADQADDALARIDGELAAVDDALVALDAGHPERSPLLQELLGS